YRFLKANTIAAPPRIVVADPITDEGLSILQEHGDVLVSTGLSPNELRERLADCDALIVRSQTRVTADVIDAAPRLRVIGRAVSRWQTAGIVWLGTLCAEVARRVSEFCMRLIWPDPFGSADYPAGVGVQLVSLDGLSEAADVITLHVPLIPSTRNLIGPRQLA